jgi:hypothetical protein
MFGGGPTRGRRRCGAGRSTSGSSDRRERARGKRVGCLPEPTVGSGSTYEFVGTSREHKGDAPLVNPFDVASWLDGSIARIGNGRITRCYGTSRPLHHSIRQPPCEHVRHEHCVGMLGEQKQSELLDRWEAAWRPMSRGKLEALAEDVYGMWTRF